MSGRRVSGYDVVDGTNPELDTPRVGILDAESCFGASNPWTGLQIRQIP